MRISLRIVLGVLSAVTVAIVAIVTLTITLTSSVSALRGIGKKHADALLAVAEGETTTLFDKGSNTVMQIVNASQSAAFPNPSESPETVAFFRGVMLSTWLLGMPEITALPVYFRDNTDLGFGLESATDPFYRFTSQIPDRPFNASDAVNQTVAFGKSYYDRVTHGPYPSMLPETRVLTQPNGPRNTGIWEQLFFATFNGFAASVLPLQAVYTVRASDGQQYLLEFLPMVAPIYTQGQSFATGHEPFAYTLITFSAESLNKFLQRTRSTPGTVAFSYDGLGYIFATSDPAAPTRILRPVSANVPAGCVSTALYANVAPTGANVTHNLVCRYALEDFPHSGLRKIASSDRAMLFPANGAGRTVRRVSAGSDVFYAATVQVPLAFRGLEVYLALLVPEDDILGDVITSRNVAIGVTCALVVLAAAVNFAVVFVLLHPLNDIAARMLRAANFEQDDDELQVSTMTEVAQLQEAYSAMSGELTRIGAYVPQSVLMARKAAINGSDGDEDADLDDGDLDKSRTTMNSQRDTADNRSNSSRHSTRSKRSTVLSGAAAAAIDVALVTRQVSVVSANLVGLHSTSNDVLLAEIAAAAEIMDDAVAGRRGALTFHGDRFLATFNAAKPCAGHAVKAASAAVAAAAAHAERGYQLRMTCGVATGVSTVGPMGSASVKALSTVGASVTGAALLERLAARGGHDASQCVLATHRIAAEVATTHMVEYIDMVVAPSTGKPLAVAALEHQAGKRRSGSSPAGAPSSTSGQPSATDDEWMYVMAKQTSPFNGVFEELHRGRVVEAVALFKELQAAAQKTGGSPTTANGPASERAPTAVPWRLSAVMDVLLKCDTSSKTAVETALLAACRQLEFRDQSKP